MTERGDKDHVFCKIPEAGTPDTCSACGTKLEGKSKHEFCGVSYCDLCYAVVLSSLVNE